MSIINVKSPATIPTKNSYSITGGEQCFGYKNNTSVQMYDLSEILGSLITNNTGNLYNVLIIKYDGTNYTLLNEGVTSLSLITYLNNNGPVWAYLIDNSNNTCVISNIITSNNIDENNIDIIINFDYIDTVLHLFNSNLTDVTPTGRK